MTQIKKWLGLFFIILGLFLLFFLLYFNFIYKEKISLNVTNSFNKNVLSLKEEKERTTRTTPEIEIENLNIKAPIVEGTEFENLEKGVGHHKNTPMPGLTGNVVLAGHGWYPGKNPYYKVFYNLDKLKIGDEIIIYYNKGKFIYEVIDQKIVSPKDTEILEQTEDPILTLYTCFPHFTAKERLVYVARLLYWEKNQ